MDIGVPVSKMEESIAAHHQVSLKTAKDLNEGPSPVYPSVQSWDDASGKTGSGKKCCHSVISGADFATQPYDVAVATPVTLMIVLIWRPDLSTRLQTQSWCICGGFSEAMRAPTTRR